MKEERGFTIIEMLVVIAVTTMIAAISIANFRTGEKQKRASLASDTIISVLRNAQNFTLTSKQIATISCTDKAPQAYLVTFASTTIPALYAIDKCNNPILIENYLLPSNTAISQFKVNGVVGTPNLQIMFTAPFAKMTTSNNGPVYAGTFSTFTTATITVGLSDGTLPRTITVDGVAGRIGE